MRQDTGLIYIKMVARISVATITEEPLSMCVARIASTHSGDLKDANDGLQAPSLDLFSLNVHSGILV